MKIFKIKKRITTKPPMKSPSPVLESSINDINNYVLTFTKNER